MVLDSLLEFAGPFVIPAGIFAVGVAGYAILRYLTRLGILPSNEQDARDND